MKTATPSTTWFNRSQLSLISLSLISITIHLTWLTLDRSQPAWDQAGHLTGVLNFQRVLTQIQIFSPDWWHDLWAQATSYRAPLIYLLTVPLFNIFGKSFHSGILVNLLFIPVIVYSTYYLAKRAFDDRIGLWAAGICLMSPALLSFQLDYLLDYGIVAITLLNLLLLTLWKDASTKLASWQWSLLFGFLFGCLMLTKPTGFLFLFVPVGFLLGSFVKSRNWLGLCQAGLVLIIAWLIFGGWFGQNWLTIITSAIAANGMGTAEGDPPGNTLAGWLYYVQLLPELISLPILIMAIGFTTIWLFKRSRYPGPIQSPQVIWLLIYLVGGYVFCSLATNKDGRFISPVLPVASIFIAYFLNLCQSIWFDRLRWFTVGLNSLLLLIHILPIPGTDGLRGMTQFGYSYPPMAQVKPELSNQSLIQSIVDNQPYLRSTIGSMVSSREINFENLDFYGHVKNFQVYVREFIGSANEEKQLIEQDIKAFNWYALKTGDVGKINKKLIPIVERDPDLQLHQSWQTRDGSILKLYRRKNIPIVVEPLTEKLKNVRLERVIIAPSSGASIDTTYQLSGDRAALQQGLLLLNWQSNGQTWTHDRGIGRGELYLDGTKIPSFRVTEHSAMLPPAKLPLDSYRLTATYLDRQTGKAYPLAVPTIEIQPTPDRPAELDFITQLHQLSKPFAQGKIDPVFSKIAILNQYDPIQDYLVQAQQSIEYRLVGKASRQENRGDNNLGLRYTLALTQALQRQIDPLLDNLTKITQQDPQNPSAWTYLGVVRLYNWQPQAAEAMLNKAEALPSPPAALATLKIVSAIFRFDLPQLIHRLQSGAK
jgi:4-amino-4-deoxy-L-arabinose transferase-like glycosyltransferase